MLERVIDEEAEVVGEEERERPRGVEHEVGRVRAARAPNQRSEKAGDPVADP